MLQEQRNIFQSVPQRWHLDWENIQPVKHVLPEGTRIHSGVQVSIGGGDDAHVHRNRLAASHALEFSLLNHAQQCDLRLHGQLADLVEENRPAVRRLEAPLAPLKRSCKRASLVSEKLRSNQRRRNRGAVHANERAR